MVVCTDRTAALRDISIELISGPVRSIRPSWACEQRCGQGTPCLRPILHCSRPSGRLSVELLHRNGAVWGLDDARKALGHCASRVLEDCIHKEEVYSFISSTSVFAINHPGGDGTVLPQQLHLPRLQTHYVPSLEGKCREASRGVPSCRY